MTIAERILLALSRPPEQSDYPEGENAGRVENALHSLEQCFPDLLNLVRGQRVLDFGCGGGAQAVALVQQGARRVVGLDTNEHTLEGARTLAREHGINEDRLCFAAKLPGELAGTFDIVITQNAMEHFPDPEGTVAEMHTALRDHGRILVTFGPPWFAPFGSHMHFFTRVPWVNILFSERTVMQVRSRFRSDGAKRYEEVESGLNRMTVARFERLVSRAGMRMEWRNYRCVKGLSFLGRPPVVRELFINDISCILVREDSAARKRR